MDYVYYFWIITLLVVALGFAILAQGTQIIINNPPGILNPALTISPSQFSRSTNTTLNMTGTGFNPNSPINIWFTGSPVIVPLDGVPVYNVMAVDESGNPEMITSVVPTTELLNVHPVSDGKGSWKLEVQYPGSGIVDMFIAMPLPGSVVNVKASDGTNTANASFTVIN